MTRDDRLKTILDVARELESRGKPVAVIDSQLNAVDGIWVGVWIFPKSRKKYVLRIGFGDNVQEHALGESKNLATKIEDWLSKHGEASTIRSKTVDPNIKKEDQSFFEL